MSTMSLQSSTYQRVFPGKIRSAVRSRLTVVSHVLCLAFLIAIGNGPLSARPQSVTFKIPPVKIPLTIKDQPISITASGVITWMSQDRDLNVLNLELKADLTELQRNMTDLMSAELDKDDHCGDRITIQNASIAPIAPASRAIVQLYYERWGCVKVFHKEEAKRLVSGDAVIQLKLTPVIEENNTQLRLIPEVESIDADHSLGDLLRSGTIGEMIREKIRKTILNAIEKGTDLAATLPPAAQGYATIKKAEFKSTTAGGLLVVLGGQISITNEQMEALARQVKQRGGSAD
jgi:hypothetical protein